MADLAPADDPAAMDNWTQNTLGVGNAVCLLMTGWETLCSDFVRTRGPANPSLKS